MVFWISYKWRLVIHICTPLGLLGVRRPRKTDENRSSGKPPRLKLPKKVYTPSNPCCDVRSGLGLLPRTSSSWPTATENWSLSVPVPTECVCMRPCPQTIVQFHISSRLWLPRSMGVRAHTQTRMQHCDPWCLRSWKLSLCLFIRKLGLPKRWKMWKHTKSLHEIWKC